LFSRWLCDGSGLIQRWFRSTVGYTDIHVTYYRQANRFDAGENLYVEWYDGATWNALETTQSGSYGDGLQDKLCGVGANENANFRIRFRTNANRRSERAFVDNVVISGTGSIADTDPPTPNPATFASSPTALSSTEITMTATTGADASPPVEYYFTETSGNPGASDSGWTTNPVFTDSGLLPGTLYSYTVQMRDSLANMGAASAAASTTTNATPPPPAPSGVYYLRAGTTTKTMPDGQMITMWGFAVDSNFGAADGVVTVPGPLLTVPPDQNNLIINLDNNLSVPVSLVIPGQITAMNPVKFTDGEGRQRVRSFTHETEPNNAVPVVYEWNNLRPGTYLYHSGTHPAVQVQMGLYGCLKKDNALGTAYVGVPYDSEVVLCFSEIDPTLHQAVADGNYGLGKPVTSTMNYQPKYFLINGQPYSAGMPPVPAGSPNDHVLIRFVNAGLETHVPVLQGSYMSVVAEDGYPYKYAKEQYSLILPALKTKDAIIIPSATGIYLVYDRRLRLTNEPQKKTNVVLSRSGA